MPQTITHLDLKRSILWEHESPKDQSTCEILTKLFIWLVDGKVYAESDTDVAFKMKNILTNLNQHRYVGRAITKAQIVKRERTDDLIYE